MPWTLMPPPQYVHAPHIAVQEFRLSPEDFVKLCHVPFSLSQPGALACSFRAKLVSPKTGTACIIVLPKDGHELNIAKLRKHELAHCNGWPGDHPGGHWEDVSRRR